MKRIVSFVILFGLLLGVVSSLSAEPIKIQYKYTAGEIDKYKMTMNMKIDAPGMSGGANAMNTSASIVFHQKTLGILPDGSAKVLTTYKDFTMSAPGTSAPPKSQIVGKSITMIMGTDGRVVKMVDNQLAQGMDMSGMMSQMGLYSMFPQEAVDVGQSWTQSVPMPMLGGNMNVTSTLLSASEPLWSKQACKIKQVFDAKMDLGEMMQNMLGAFAGNNPNAQQAVSEIKGELNMSGWGMSYFSPEIGKMLKAEGSVGMTVSITMPQQARQQGAPSQFNMTMNMDINMTRFK